MSIHKIACLWLCVVLLLLIIPGCGAEEVVSTTESGFTTRFNPNTGTLTVSGEGTLKNYFHRVWVSNHPAYHSETVESNTTVKKLILEEGIVGLDNCFNDMIALKTIVFPSSLSQIRRSFISCTQIAKLSIPINVMEIAEDSFSHCTNVSTLDLEGRKRIIHGAFAGMDSLTEVTIPDRSTLCDSFNECYSLENVTFGEMVGCHAIVLEMGEICKASFGVSDKEKAKKRTYYMPEIRLSSLDEGVSLGDDWITVTY